MADSDSDANPTAVLPDAKKLRRKGCLHLVIVVFAVFALLSGGAYLWWCRAFEPHYSEAEIEAKVAEIKARLTPSPIPDERNRAAAYRAALEKWLKGTDIYNLPGYNAFMMLSSPRLRDPNGLADLKAEIAGEAAHLDHLIAASKLPECVWPDEVLVYGPAGNPNGSGYMGVLTAARFLSFAAWVSFDAGEDERGAALLTTELRLGCDLSASASFVRRMIAMATISLACDIIRNLCGYNMMGSQARASVIASLRQCLTDEAPLEQSFEVELVEAQEAWIDASVQTGLGSGSGFQNYLQRMVPDPYVRSVYFESELAMIGATKLDPKDARRMLKRFQAAVQRAGPFDSFLLFPMLSTFAWAYDQMLAVRMDLRGTLALLTLLEIHDRDGLYPEKLTPESTGLSAMELTDPFKGACFSYQLWGESFRLWSVGEKGKYQGGPVTPKSHDFDEEPLFWPLIG